MSAAIASPLELPGSRSATPVQHDGPVAHPVADVLPNRGDFFDPTAAGGGDFLTTPSTTVSQIFAIMRQWVPHSQKNMSLLIKELLRRGCHIDDRDGLTDATLLHYACKSSAAGAGDREAGKELVKILISQGADVCAVCRWTGMQPLHYAAYFDAADVVDLLIHTGRCDVDVQCVDAAFDKSTPLHIATANYALEAAERLLHHGSNPWLRNSEGCCAIDCIPGEDSELANVLKCVGRQDVGTRLQNLLRDAMARVPKPDDFHSTPGVLSNPARREVKVGDRVLVNGRRYGHARYIGRVRFTPASTGCSRYPSVSPDHVWVGVELEQATGENSGTVDGREYFSCPTRKGTFAPVGDVAVAKHDGVRLREVTSRLGSSAGSGGSGSSSRSTRRTSSGSNAGPAAGARKTSGGSTSATSSPHKLTTSTSARGARPVRVSAVDAQEMRSFAKTAASQPDGGTTMGKKVSSSSDFQVGDSVLVSGKKAGVVRFIGETDFAQGVWYGIQLEKGDGKNDGSVGGTRYFSCKPNHGIFAPLFKLSARVPSSSSASRISSSSSSVSLSSSDRTGSRHRSTATGRAAGSSSTPGSATPTAGTGTAGGGGGGGGGGSTSAPTPSLGVDGNDAVDLMNCKVLVNSEMAVIKYIGEVDFGDGVWLGVDMKTSSGKHDGSVKGKRYFTCKQDHGLMIKPQRATYRGISCASILSKQSA
ncbi:CAP-Gly domain-containing linker protein 3-like [Sycon ciliatum]|uniref:CAP-Gly domain-containing linker protein 3-like n=1 Tax=Sycon ciliatum TaxID=27933 RepID=UPI0031F62B10